MLNLEGVFTRYEDAEEQLERISGFDKDEATAEMQRIYQEPIKPELIAKRIGEIKEMGVPGGRVADPAARAQALRGGRSRQGWTSWSSRARSSRPSTCPPTRSARR